ncbi:myc box-dependent-interacting protein 1b [Aplochiton taeniatus]
MAEMGKGVTAGKLAINVQKKLTRAQEKVLQKLGKADETRDTAFEETLCNFNKQMVEGSKLQRDLKAYLAAVKIMHEASRKLQDCLADMYDPEWFGKEEVDSMVEDTDILWTDYTQKLVDNSIVTLDTYLAQFPDIKTRIAKRERKMVDFDSARHHFASVQKGKKKDEAKIAKPVALLEKAAPSWAQGLISAHQVAQTNLSWNQAEEELGRSQKVFEELNVELQDELPQLWDNRVGVYVITFQSLAGHQEKFHREMGKLSHNLNDIMTKLDEQRTASEGANHSVTPDSTPKLRPGPPPSRPPPRPSLTPTPTQDLKRDSIINMFEEAKPEQTAVAQDLQEAPEDQGGWEDDGLAAPQAYTQPSWGDARGQQSWDNAGGQPSWGDAGGQPSWDNAGGQPSWGDAGGQPSWGDAGGQPSWTDAGGQPSWDNAGGQPSWDNAGGQPSWGDDPATAQPGWVQEEEEKEGEGGWGAEGGGGQAGQAGWADSEPQWEQSNAVTNGSEEADLPTGFLYKVKAMHDYAATDGDELEMKSGDVVLVVAIDNPDEQDDGWLMGMKESDWLEKKEMAAKGVFPENFTQKL